MPMPAQQPQQQATAQPDVLDQAITSVLPAQPAQNAPASAPAQAPPDPSKAGGVLGAAALGALKATQPTEPKQPDVLDTAITSVLNPNAETNTAAPPEKPSFLSKVESGVEQSMPVQMAKSVWETVQPPQDAKEHTVLAVGGVEGLLAYRTAKAVAENAEQMFKAKPQEFQQARQDFSHAVRDFHNSDYRNALSDVASTGADVMGLTGNPLSERFRELSEGARPSGNLVTPVTKDVIDLAALAASENADAAKDLAGRITDKVTDIPSRIKGSVTGQTALQESAQSVAAKTAENANVAASQASVSGTFEQVADNIYSKAKDLYKQIDDASGVDLKRLREKISNARQEIRGLSDAPEDVEREAKLEASIKNNEDALQRAQQTAVANGVDPNTLKAADASFKQSQALYDLDKNVKTSTAGRTEATGGSETIDPKKLSPKLEKMWDSGRLQDAVGEENAKQLVSATQDALKRGQYIRAAKLVGRIALWATAGYELRNVLFHGLGE